MNTQIRENSTTEPQTRNTVSLSEGDWVALKLFEDVLKKNIETTQQRYDYFRELVNIIEEKNNHDTKQE